LDCLEDNKRHCRLPIETLLIADRRLKWLLKDTSLIRHITPSQLS
jgi:hypothetical protein